MNEHNRTYYPGLDVLRCIAILLVLLHHYISEFQIGWIGVDLFFVLSGFLVTNILISNTFSKAHLLSFYINRALRIFPIYYVTLALFFLLSPLFFSEKAADSTYAYYNLYQGWFWAFLQNWFFVTKGPPHVPYLTHFWSLAVEWLFYLVWPLLILYFRNKASLKVVVIILIITSLVVRTYTFFYHQHQVETYYCNSLCRMDSLLMGSFLAIRLSNSKPFSSRFLIFVTFLFFLLWVVSWLLYKSYNNNIIITATIGYSIIGLFFMSIIYWFLTNKKLAHLKLQPLNFIGKISYGIYIYYLPIYLIISTKFGIWLNLYMESAYIKRFVIILFSFGFTLLVSTGSYYLFEKPIWRLRKH